MRQLSRTASASSKIRHTGAKPAATGSNVLSVEARQLRAVVAHNIRAFAEQRCITLNALADFAAVSRSQLFNVLACSSSPSLDWIARVATALELQPWELLIPARTAARRNRKRARAS